MLYKDKSILQALLIIVCIEGSMQFGCYKHLLKKNSYASNVNRIIDHALSKKVEIDPDILILGTSIAYEGISVKLLNEKLLPLNLKAQSLAIPSSDLVIQELALEKVLKKFKNVRYIIHVNEPETAWAAERVISYPSLAMANEFDRIDVIGKFKKYGFDMSKSNIAYLVIRLWAYRHDLADFILSPLKRIKDLARSHKVLTENLYTYENSYEESLELYPFTNLEESLALTQNSAPVAKGSNQCHKDTVFRTCKIAKESIVSLDEDEKTQLFEKRLSIFYKSIRLKNIKIINVFPPLPNYLEHFHHRQRIAFWEKNYKESLGDTVIDLKDSIPLERNASYYYDILHLNRKGMILFTEKIGESVTSYILKSEKEMR